MRLLAPAIALFLFPLSFSAPGEEWIDLFGRDGIQGDLRAATLVGDHIVVSGRFFSLGGERAYSVASYNIADNSWEIVPTDLGEGSVSFAVAGLELSRGLAVLAAFDGRLSQYYDGRVREMPGLGPASVADLTTINLEEGQRALALGTFEQFPGASMVVWDGTRWTPAAVGAGPLRNPIIFRRNGREVFAASQDNGLYIWDGTTEQLIDFPDRTGRWYLAALDGDLVVCEDSQLSRWDGFSLEPMALQVPSSSRCRDLSFRSTPGGDQLMFPGLVTDGQFSWVEDTDHPYACYTESISQAGWLLDIDAGRSTAGELCIWNGESWTVASAGLRSAKPAVFGFRPLHVTDAGPALWNQGSDLLAWSEDRFAAVDLGFSPAPGSIPSRDLSRFYSVLGGQLRIESAQGEQLIPLGGQGAYADVLEIGQNRVVVAVPDLGDVQFVEYDGEVRPLGKPLPINNVPKMTYLPESSPTPGLYTVSTEIIQTKSCGGARRYRMRRFANDAWSDITPQEFTGSVFNCEVPVLSVLEFEGEERLFAAFGGRFGYFTGADWFLFPENPGADLLGPVALVNRPNGPCFFVAASSTIHRYCSGRWSQPKALKAYLAWATAQMIGQMMPTTYQGRTALLVRGIYHAVGATAQPGLAILDLDSLFSDGIEY
ncbi:MAG: hypothetical protein AAGA23_04410 [Pseudomonadota bacterium]